MKTLPDSAFQQPPCCDDIKLKVIASYLWSPMYISQPLHAAQLHTAIWVSNFSLDFSFSSVFLTPSSYSTQKKLPYAPLSVTMLHVLAAILTTLIGTVAGQGACFVPNGTNRHDLTNANIQKYASCESSGHGMCCNIAGDKCQADGLCWNEEHKQLWRESCTDPTWESSKCLKLCITDDYGKLPSLRNQA